MKPRLPHGIGCGLFTVLVVHRRLDVVHSCVGHAAPVEDIEPLFRGFRLRFGFDHRFELDAVFDSERVRLESGVGFPVGLAQAVAQDSEEAVVAAAEEDVAVGGLECFVRDDGCLEGLAARIYDCRL